MMYFSASLISMDCKPRSRSYRRVLPFPSLSATAYAPLELHVFQRGLKQQMTMSSLQRKETRVYLSSYNGMWKRKYGLCFLAVKTWMCSTIRKMYGLSFSSKIFLFFFFFLLATCRLKIDCRKLLVSSQLGTNCFSHGKTDFVPFH